MMKRLAGAYFNVLRTALCLSHMLTPRQISILSSTRESHVQDFLLTIPIDGLGQRLNPRQYLSVLCYRLTVPLYAEGSLCPSYNSAKIVPLGAHRFSLILLCVPPWRR